MRRDSPIMGRFHGGPRGVFAGYICEGGTEHRTTARGSVLGPSRGFIKLWILYFSIIEADVTFMYAGTLNAYPGPRGERGGVFDFVPCFM